MENVKSEQWQKTACIICALNCGLEVQTKEGHITRVRADKNHPISQGYLCEKAQRMDNYQNGSDRLSSPMRRKSDGSYEAISWELAISEIAAKFLALKQEHGGESIFYYGGGSQGNHLGATYADSTIKALGIQYRSNALAQEKTGEAWVQGKMVGAGVHTDFEHAEVSVFLGKNPWQSHGFARARVILRDIQNDPNRCLIVIDPRKTETAKMADFHLAVKPGTDAWLLAAMSAIIIQENLAPLEWHAQHTQGFEEIAAVFRAISVPDYAKICDVDEELIRAATRRISKAKSMSMLEDLGVQMNIHSTLNSYLNRLVWFLTGNFGKKGTNNVFIPLMSLSSGARDKAQGGVKTNIYKTSPVTGAKVVMGLIPCNSIPEEILTDHPKRFRGILIESSNPVHSLADSQKMREAIRALDISVVIDVAMTETASQADYVLPASSQFEKAEATFFNLEIPQNAFHLRQPLFEPRLGTLTEAEIHSRLVEALGELNSSHYTALKFAAKFGLVPFAMAFLWKSKSDKAIKKYASIAIYRSLGVVLSRKLAPAASLWGVCQIYVAQQKQAAANAGFSGNSLFAGNKLFKAILNNASGTIFAKADYEASWKFVRNQDNKINLIIPEMIEELKKLAKGELPRDIDFPLLLSAGERRTETANTSIRDSSWHKKGNYGTLRISTQDAAKLPCASGDLVRVTTRRGNTEVEVEITSDMQQGHISLPNGLGLDHQGGINRKGVSLNELTGITDRDPFFGTPWHKRVPARIELV